MATGRGYLCHIYMELVRLHIPTRPLQYELMCRTNSLLNLISNPLYILTLVLCENYFYTKRQDTEQVLFDSWDSGGLE